MLSKDIHFFFSRQLDELIEDSILLAAAQDQKDVLLRHAADGADGMFLWAKLMAVFLRCPAFTPTQRLEIIKDINLPEGLEKMYHRIFSFIWNSGRTSQQLASKILT
jgi:hypothetical protein